MFGGRIGRFFLGQGSLGGRILGYWGWYWYGLVVYEAGRVICVFCGSGAVGGRVLVEVEEEEVQYFLEVFECLREVGAPLWSAELPMHTNSEVFGDYVSC